MVGDHPWLGEITDSGFFGVEGGDGAEALDPAVVELIDELVSAAPPGREGLLRVLLGLQRTFKRVSWRVQELVADRYGLSPAQVAGLVSFFPGLSAVRRGRLELTVCTGTSCWLQGSRALLQSLEDAAREIRQETEEPRIEVRHERCLGTCGRSPTVRVHDRALPSPDVAEAAETVAGLLDGPAPSSEER